MVTSYITIGHGRILHSILRNILTLKIKPPKLILQHLYENFWIENNLLQDIRKKFEFEKGSRDRNKK